MKVGSPAAAVAEVCPTRKVDLKGYQGGGGLSWREAYPLNHLGNAVDPDRKVLNKELSL